MPAGLGVAALGTAELGTAELGTEEPDGVDAVDEDGGASAETAGDVGGKVNPLARLLAFGALLDPVPGGVVYLGVGGLEGVKEPAPGPGPGLGEGRRAYADLLGNPPGSGGIFEPGRPLVDAGADATPDFEPEPPNLYPDGMAGGVIGLVDEPGT